MVMLERASIKAVLTMAEYIICAWVLLREKCANDCKRRDICIATSLVYAITSYVIILLLLFTA